MTPFITPVTRGLVSTPDAQAAIWFLGALSRLRLGGEQAGGAFSLAGNLARRTGTPAQLAGAETEFGIDRFMKVTIELGDVLLGPPGAKPADVRPGDGASAG